MVIFEKSCVKGSQLIWQSIWHISSFSYFRKLAHLPQPSGNASLINQLSSTLRKIFHQLKAQMTFSILSNKVFLVKVCTFIWHNFITYLIQYSIVRHNFICTGKQKILCDSLYSNFAELRWSQPKLAISPSYPCAAWTRPGRTEQDQCEISSCYSEWSTL